VLDDPACELLVAGVKVADVRAADLLAVRPFSCSANLRKNSTVSGSGSIGPGSTRTSTLGSSGYRAPRSTAIIPPRLWPTTTGRSIPTRAQNAARSSARLGIE
jgi:hypothetical protein